MCVGREGVGVAEARWDGTLLSCPERNRRLNDVYGGLSGADPGFLEWGNVCIKVLGFAFLSLFLFS